MLRFIKRLFAGVLALALGIGLAGCSAGTDTAPKGNAPQGKKVSAEEVKKARADMIEIGKKKMEQKYGKGGDSGEKPGKDEEKGKEKKTIKEKPLGKDKND